MLKLDSQQRMSEASGRAAINLMAKDLAEDIRFQPCGRIYSAESGGAAEVLPAKCNRSKTK
jgi:hypothetical protein